MNKAICTHVGMSKSQPQLTSYVCCNDAPRISLVSRFGLDTEVYIPPLRP